MLHVTLGLAADGVATAMSCCVEPSITVAESGSTAMEASVEAVTVTKALADFEPSTALVATT